METCGWNSWRLQGDCTCWLSAACFSLLLCVVVVVMVVVVLLHVAARACHSRWTRKLDPHSPISVCWLPGAGWGGLCVLVTPTLATKYTPHQHTTVQSVQHT